MPARRRALAALATAVLLAACGGSDGEPQPRPEGPLADALAQVGGGGTNGSLGVGWAEPELVASAGLSPELIEQALGPNAGSVIERAGELRRRFGFDPLDAQRLTSLGGSYAYGLRLDGLDAPRLSQALVAAGGRMRTVDGVDLLAIGDYAVVPSPLLDAGIRGLGAFDAFGESLVVLAISDRARAALLGEGDRLIDEPVYAATTDCLGDVAAARMIPDKQLLATDLLIDLVATGVSSGSEVLCLVGGDAERADEIAATLERSLGPGAREPDSGEPIARSLRSIEISRDARDGIEIVRVQAQVPPGAEPGFWFGAIARGSVVAIVNGSRTTFQRD